MSESVHDEADPGQGDEEGDEDDPELSGRSVAGGA
jgi:hypothetical protein